MSEQEQEREDEREVKVLDVTQLSRAERIREEAKRAAQHGQAPKTPLSLHPTFRVEGLTSTAPAAAPPGASFLELSRKMLVTTREGNRLVRQESAALLAAQINDGLQRVTPKNRAQLAPEILAAISSLQIASPHAESTAAIRRKVLTALFGESFFESEKDLPMTRGHSRGGSVEPNAERIC